MSKKTYDEREDRLATPQEACQEYACNHGADNPDQPWILTDFDTWEPNPFFKGDRGPHPEDDSDCYEDVEEETINKDRDELIFRGE